jgi:hypothetical protein
LGETTNDTFFDATYSDCALAIGPLGIARIYAFDPASAPLLVPYAVAAGHSFYFHATFGYGDGNHTDSVVLQILDAAGDLWLELGANLQLSYNSGTGGAPVWTALGTATPAGYDGHLDMDIKVDIDAGGNHHVTLLIARVVALGPFAFSAAGLTNVASVRLCNTDVANTAWCWSQGLLTEDISTVGAHAATTRGTGAGAHSAWAGAVGGVNAPITSDASPNQAAAAGLSQTYPQTNVTVPAGYYIAGAFNYVRGKNDGSGLVMNIQSICRPASTDHLTADLAGIGVGYSTMGARYDTNPDTSATWTQGEWNAPVQLGFASAA